MKEQRLTMMAKQFYLTFQRRGHLAHVVKWLYYLTLRPAWMPRLWAQGEREWSDAMFEAQLRDSGIE